MIQGITQLIERKLGKRNLSFTKFCQRIVQAHTKVLFLVTHQDKPLCIVKTVRGAAFNEGLKREKELQESIAAHRNCATPRIYFDGLVGGRYVYAEEVVEGAMLSQKEALKREYEVVDFIRTFPAIGTIATNDIAVILTRYVPKDNTSVFSLVQRLQSSNIVLRKGVTHSDLGRPNILVSRDKLYVIDWERAGDLPFWLIDAVYFMAKQRTIQNLNDWQQKAEKAFAEYTGVDAETATALYCVQVVCDYLYKKYPGKYAQAIKQFSITL